jgi:UTP--glucose-1-phosphate uridylyltransferase
VRQRLVGNEPFAVLLADDLMVGDAAGAPADGRAVRRVARQHPGRAGGAGRAHPALRHRGRHRVNDRPGGRVRIVEKPAPEDAPSRLGVAGRYILTPGVFHEIATQPRGVGGEIQLTDGIASLLRREKVFAYRYEGPRYDCGSKEGFLEANVELALAHPQLGRASATS